MKYPLRRNKGFTLIELLVVVAIISLLSGIVFASLNSTRKKARIAVRINTLHQIKMALEFYASDNNGLYPMVNDINGWRSDCNAWWNSSAQTANNPSPIPGLVPTYLSKWPSDSQLSFLGNAACYAYGSPDGKEYKLMFEGTSEMTNADYLTHPELVDPDRDGFYGGFYYNGNIPTLPTQCDGTGDNTAIYSWAIYTPGPGRCF